MTHTYLGPFLYLLKLRKKTHENGKSNKAAPNQARISSLSGFVVLILFILLSTGCAARNPEPAASISPTGAATSSPVATAIPVPTTFPQEDRILALPSSLRIEEHILREAPSLEPLTFTPLQGSQMDLVNRHAAERNPFPERNLYEDGFFSMSANLGPDRLTATESFTENTTATQVAWQKVAVQVKRNGRELVTIPAGDASPRNALRGLWVYGEHWVLEIVSTVQSFTAPNTVSSDTTGEIYEDGISLNQRNAYEESFGFQTIDDRPFYFYKRGGQIGIWFDGQETGLGYTGIPHYGCCSAGALNPRSYQNSVMFFAERGGHWYYVEIGVFGAGR